MQYTVKAHVVEDFDPPENFKKHVWRAGMLFTKYIGLAFVQETAKYMQVDTGMSLASLVPFAEALQVRNINIATKLAAQANTGKAKKWYDPFRLRNQKFHRRIRKTAKLGRRLGKEAFTVSFGSYIRPFYQLHYDIVVTQFHIHDPTWLAVKKGQLAAKHYERVTLRSHLEPQVRKGLIYYIKTGRIPPPISLPAP